MVKIREEIRNWYKSFAIMKGFKNITAASEDLSKVAGEKLSPKLIITKRKSDVNEHSGNLSPHRKVMIWLGSCYHECMSMLNVC